MRPLAVLRWPSSRKMASTRPSFQSCPTEMRVSLHAGQWRTFVMITLRGWPPLDMITTCRSPIWGHLCGLRSMPVIVSEQGRRFFKWSSVA